MSSILQINKDNYEGYLKLYQIKIRARQCVESTEKFNPKQFLLGKDIDYGMDTLSLLYKNARLTRDELDEMGFVLPVHTLNSILLELRQLNEEMIFLKIQYPYVDTEIPIDELVASLIKVNLIDVHDSVYCNHDNESVKTLC